MNNINTVKPARDNTLDKYRGLLILYIVAIVHGLFWLSVLPDTYSSLILFEMPLIFIISGYAYYLFEQASPEFSSKSFTSKQYLKFATTRFLRILIPYYLYVIVCILILYSFSLVEGVQDYSFTTLVYQWLNPSVFGGAYSYSKLNSHLWFIHIFLIITLLMPLVTRFFSIKKSNVFLVFIASIFIFYLLSDYEFWRHGTLKQTLFYLIFAVLGYSLAISKSFFQSQHYLKISLIMLIGLLTIVLITGNIHTMNMQSNKFPPNHIFFIFSCMWSAIFLHFVFKRLIVVKSIAKLLDCDFMKPFIKYGYSIYLWQGLGYTFAIELGLVANFHLIVVWLLALALSVGLGLIFGPIERVKIRVFKN